METNLTVEGNRVVELENEVERLKARADTQEKSLHRLWHLFDSLQAAQQAPPTLQTINGVDREAPQQSINDKEWLLRTVASRLASDLRLGASLSSASGAMASDDSDGSPVVRSLLEQLLQVTREEVAEDIAKEVRQETASLVRLEVANAVTHMSNTSTSVGPVQVPQSLSPTVFPPSNQPAFDPPPVSSPSSVPKSRHVALKPSQKLIPDMRKRVFDKMVHGLQQNEILPRPAGLASELLDYTRNIVPTEQNSKRFRRDEQEPSYIVKPSAKARIPRVPRVNTWIDVIRQWNDGSGIQPTTGMSTTERDSDSTAPSEPLLPMRDWPVAWRQLEKRKYLERKLIADEFDFHDQNEERFLDLYADHMTTLTELRSEIKRRMDEREKESGATASTSNASSLETETPVKRSKRRPNRSPLHPAASVATSTSSSAHPSSAVAVPTSSQFTQLLLPKPPLTPIVVHAAEPQGRVRITRLRAAASGPKNAP